MNALIGIISIIPINHKEMFMCIEGYRLSNVHKKFNCVFEGFIYN